MPLHDALLGWFDQHKRDLPWRLDASPYAIWLSEVMLQQTQVQTVIPYYRRFLARFPTVRQLAQAELDEVLFQWKGLGYYSRARNLHRAAKAIVERHGGELPVSATALLELPGFGRYTAGAVASIAFHQPVALVDGNVARVLGRLFAIEGATGEKVREGKLWAKAAELVSESRPGDWNQALMELGATVCLPKGAQCDRCPVRAECLALAQGLVETIPAPKIRAPRKVLRWAVAVCERDGKLLLGRRPAKGLFGGLWELPSAELAAKASAPAALAKLFGKKPTKVTPLGKTHRTLTHRELELELYQVKLSGKVAAESYQALEWVARAEVARRGMSTAMRAALEQLTSSGTSRKKAAGRAR
jgi:A/G-specific adenine glycosylase